MPSLGKDLATIRNNLGLSLEDLQQSTKVPPNILRSIEDDSIYDQQPDNTTYIRSYVRSYAKAVGVKEQDIVKALNQKEAGNYDGSLAEKSSTKAGSSDKKEADPEKATNYSPTFKISKKTPEKSPKKTSNKDKTASTEHSVSSVDWVDVGRRVNPAQAQSRIWSGLLVITLVVAILAATFFIYNYYSSSPAEEATPDDNSAVFEPETPSDSLRESLITEGNEPVTANSASTNEQAALGDTLSIAVYAATGQLEPVRVYTDILGRRNPYWVPEGDTLRFNFVNTVRIRAINQYDRLQLLFNGHVIQNFFEQYYNDETGMIELDRSFFEDDPKWRTPVNN